MQKCHKGPTISCYPEVHFTFSQILYVHLRAHIVVYFNSMQDLKFFYKLRK